METLINVIQQRSDEENWSWDIEGKNNIFENKFFRATQEDELFVIEDKVKKDKFYFAELKDLNNYLNDFYSIPFRYLLPIKGELYDVNDLLNGIDLKLTLIDTDVTRPQFNYFSNCVEYILRSFFKKQTIEDLKKTKNEIDLLIKEIEKENV